MDARALLARHGEHAEGIAVAQILLGGEGKLGEVGEVAAIVGMHAGGIELCAVERRVVIGMAQRPAQPFELQAPRSRRAGVLDRVEPCRAIGSIPHGEPRRRVRDWPRNSATTSPSASVTCTS